MPCDMGMTREAINSNEIYRLKEELKRLKDQQMPCNSDQEQVMEERERVQKEQKCIGILCALITEIKNRFPKEYEEIFENAEDNGMCDNIADWFLEHRLDDIDRLMRTGLPTFGI